MHRIIRDDQIGTLMIVYGLGFAAVFLILALLYVHANRKGAVLHLTPLEAFDTRTSAWQHLATASVGLLSVAIALALGPAWAGVAGLTYMLIAVVQTVFGMVRGKYRRRLIAGLAATA